MAKATKQKVPRNRNRSDIHLQLGRGLSEMDACRGLWELGQYSIRATYANIDGMTFSDINRDGTGMGTIWLIFVVEWAVFLGLAWYLEQVISNATGIRKHWLFPFQCAAPPLPPRHAPSTQQILSRSTSCLLDLGAAAHNSACYVCCCSIL